MQSVVRRRLGQKTVQKEKAGHIINRSARYRLDVKKNAATIIQARFRTHALKSDENFLQLKETAKKEV